MTIFNNKKSFGRRGRLTKLLNKDVKELNGIILSLFCVSFLITVGIISYKVNSSYAIFTDTIKGEKTIELTVSNDLNKTTVFTFKEEAQEYVVPKDGYYYIEMAGASGAPINYRESFGAKVSGYIYLEVNEKLYFYVGKQGEYANTNCRSTGYEFNGGGIAKPSSTGVCGATGGGATDVRLIGGNWDDMTSLISRIMVAGAASPSDSISQYTIGNGGALYGEKPIFSTYQSYLGNPGTQINGGAAPTKYSGAQSNGTAGSFGKGGYGGASASDAVNAGGAGGGAGYYGGSGASGLTNGTWPGGGGSSYISGYAGVNSVEESTTIKHTNQTLHYSGKYFIGGKMLEGQNSGNGYAKITYIDTKPKRKNKFLNNVRYIKNCSSYSSSNNYNHWNELQAIKDGVNVAKGKTVTGTTAELSTNPYSRITDGDITYSSYAQAASQTTNQCITVDLEEIYDLDEIAIWNCFDVQKSYYDNITYVSDDNSSWTTLINEAVLETSNGHRVNAYTDTYNGYIQDGLVLWYDGYANTGATRNHTTTTWKDLSGSGYNGTLNGGTWNNNYLYFDGINDTVVSNVTASTLLPADSDRTLSILLKVNSLPYTDTTNGNTGLFFGATHYSGIGIYWARSNSGIGVHGGIRTSTGIVTSKFGENKILEEGILQLVFVNNPTNGKIISYVNGVKKEENLSTTGSYEYTSYMGNIGINKAQIFSSSYTTSYANMNVYSAKIYNKALTDEEVYHNYMYDKERFNLE